MQNRRTKKRTTREGKADQKKRIENAAIIQQMIACSFSRKFPDDYREKEGVGRK